MEFSTGQLEDLEDAARLAAEQSYSPHSNFPVGAAVMTTGGEIYSGANVENGSYGLTICASGWRFLMQS